MQGANKRRLKYRDRLTETDTKRESKTKEIETETNVKSEAGKEKEWEIVNG